ncbi:MAG: CHASE domain-containing protein [Bacteroidetes bacterium]|nr:CHASE domain-containing protein [Bacteroidota bacterium]
METIKKNTFEDVIKTSSKKKNVIFDFSKTWIAYIVLILLAIGSYFIKDIVEGRMAEELNSEFEKAYLSVTSRLNNQYDRLYQVMRSTQGLYYQVEEVVRDYFELNGAVPVKNFPAIMSFNYAPKVAHSNLPEFSFNALRQGYNNYSLHPKVLRDYYYPVVHIVNYELNTHRLAFDYASQDVMKNAIELAQSKNMMVSTEFFDLRPDTLSFALIAPIFNRYTNFTSPEELQKKFLGSVVMEINANTYFQNAIKGNESESDTTDTDVYYSVIDKNTAGEENIVFKSDNYDQFVNTKSLLNQEVIISIANRELVVKFATVPTFGLTKANLPNIVLIVSLALSVLAFLLILILLTQKARAEEIAERMTASQRRILDTSRDIIAIASKEGNWLSMNPASLPLLGEPSDQVIGKNIVSYLYSDKDIKIWNEVLANKEENQRVDIRVKNTTDGFIWLNFSFTKPAKENLIYVIGRDVTAEKLAAEEIKFRSKQIELANCFEQEASATKVNLMIQLSHEMRNQLTGMMGYLQLITSGAFDNDEELQVYAGSAYESAESAFTYIHDISEATIGDTNTMAKVAIHKMEDTINPVLEKYKKDRRSINIEYAEHGKDSCIIVDNAILFDVWTKIFRILSIDNPNNKIHITANENKLEGVTEIIIEAPSFPELARVTSIYNDAPSKVIERLREDTEDIMLDIAMISSLITRMMGTFNIENMEDNKTTYIFITLPLVLRTRE